MGPNTRIFENWPNIRIAKSYLIIQIMGGGGGGGGGDLDFIWLKKKSHQKLSEECTGKIFDLRKIIPKGNTLTVCV